MSSTNNNMLDPYALLGVAVDSTPAEVKKAYYELSLLCHPDKGGSASDMTCLHAAYRFVMHQSSAANRAETVESLEARFADFCERQMATKPPSFCDIADEVDGETRAMRRMQFDAVFSKGVQDGHLSGAADPDGYGSYMAPSEYIAIASPCFSPIEYNPKVDVDPNTSAAASTFRPFVNAVVRYNEPAAQLIACSMSQAAAGEVSTASTAGAVGFTGTTRSGKGLDTFDYKIAFDTAADANSWMSDAEMSAANNPRTWEDVSNERRDQDRLFAELHKDANADAAGALAVSLQSLLDRLT